MSWSYITNKHSTLFENNVYGFISNVMDSFLGAYELDASTYIDGCISYKSINNMVSCYEPVTKTRTPCHIEDLNLKFRDDKKLDIGDYNYNEVIIDPKKSKIIGIFYKDGVSVDAINKLKKYIDVEVIHIPQQKIKYQH